MKELTEFVEYYREALATAEMGGRFEKLMERIPSPAPLKEVSSGEYGGIELAYEPYFEPFDEPACWAASTEEPQGEPLRFSSQDGVYFLREFPGDESGEPRYMLVADKGAPTGGVDIEIDGVRVRTDGSGTLSELPPGFNLSKDSRIILRPGTPQ
jgi:hypothetical protein